VQFRALDAVVPPIGVYVMCVCMCMCRVCDVSDGCVCMCTSVYAYVCVYCVFVVCVGKKMISGLERVEQNL